MRDAVLVTVGGHPAEFVANRAEIADEGPLLLASLMVHLLASLAE
jgi:hypothetical protein